MSTVFNRLELQAFRAGITPRTKESRAWFQQKIKNLRSINREALMKEEPLKQVSTEIVGSMYMFFYDPKHKETLPYYDTFPLVVVVGPAEGGFLGLNLHYLPPILRAKMLDGLMEITTNNKFNDSTRFKMTYELLARASKFKYYKPCLKHYLNKQVKSKFALVPAPEWEIATFLPTAQFRKANSKKVYADSKKMIGG
jgi:hypothetical protein